MKTNLTEEKLLNKKFKKDIKGYEALEVDEYLDLVIKDYKIFKTEIKELNNELFNLKRENESLKSTIREKDVQISIEKSKAEVLEKSKNYSSNELDPLDLLQKCSKYEVKLYELGIDPSKIK